MKNDQSMVRTWSEQKRTIPGRLKAGQEQQVILTTSPAIVLVGSADVVSDSILHPQTFR
jgi:hypothetical protein